ncbi:ParB-like nuclease [Sphaerochaeta pleomorpha str. Grapes]|uniref:ParB-like nuclease n=1 Tax=Sphaerochaeta pleomorpha (strain ATCC BAA-1885 / DSM 22778 / Grapes) TaxID=158190 RepID=G8QTH9_SPHPG|nr:ParB/Srx family N-terminal domain-containing protein [Sphaerochaeta pleomorpha]AEV30220.1 ParB-like nuclease [Sphaerochaeta pleomorpha str. Grapes]
MAKSNYMELSINEVELDITNPRIKMYLENYSEITSEGIALALNGAASDGAFLALRESIRANGGVINPILVNHNEDDKYIVIEGNTRLQIYKDFLVTNPSGPWRTIRAIVYENMTEEEIHSIRLQTHLVGPRDWDPYSKAKYLDYLMNDKRLPLNAIISYCGGKKTEILKLVAAYQDMQRYYVTKTKELEFDLDYKDFSKFSELQNKGIIDALRLNNFTKIDFSTWVLNRNIDTAQNVRLLPTILKDKDAKAEFLRTNISEAYKRVNLPITAIDLSSIDYFSLCQALTAKLDKICYKEAKYLQSDKGEEKRAALLLLSQSIEFILDEGSEEE